MKSSVGRHRASGLLEDEQREGDDPQPVAELVDRVGEDQAPEGRPVAGGLSGVGRSFLNLHCILHKFACICTSFRQNVLQTCQEANTIFARSCAEGGFAIANGRSWIMGFKR